MAASQGSGRNGTSSITSLYCLVVSLFVYAPMIVWRPAGVAADEVTAASASAILSTSADSLSSSSTSASASSSPSTSSNSHGNSFYSDSWEDDVDDLFGEEPRSSVYHYDYVYEYAGDRGGPWHAEQSRIVEAGSRRRSDVVDDELQSSSAPLLGAASLTFVFDVTGSMYDDLQQVIEGAARILATTLAMRDKPLYSYVLVPFHDPGQ